MRVTNTQLENTLRPRYGPDAHYSGYPWTTNSSPNSVLKAVYAPGYLDPRFSRPGQNEVTKFPLPLHPQLLRAPNTRCLVSGDCPVAEHIVRMPGRDRRRENG